MKLTRKQYKRYLKWLIKVRFILKTYCGWKYAVKDDDCWRTTWKEGYTPNDACYEEITSI